MKTGALKVYHSYRYPQMGALNPTVGTGTTRCMTNLPSTAAKGGESLRDLRRQHSAIENLIRALNRYERTHPDKPQAAMAARKSKSGRKYAGAAAS